MKKLIRSICNHQLVVGLVMLNAVLFIIYTPTHYYFEMFQSMAFQVLLVCIAFLIVFSLNKKWVGSLSSLLAIFLLSVHLPLYHAKSNVPSNLSIAHFNVLKLNHNYDKTIAAAIATDADFLSFNEVSPEWEIELSAKLKKDYPYSACQLAENNSFGIAVFSKSPIKDLVVHYWGSNEIPSLTGNVSFLGTKINFVAAHTIPPVSKNYFTIRNNHLHAIKDYLANIEGTKVLIGDLNAVSWSEPIMDIRNSNHLEDSRKSWLPTYPAWFQLAAIPIDHIFYSQDMHCTNFYTIKSTESDHYGIVGKYHVNELMGQK